MKKIFNLFLFICILLTTISAKEIYGKPWVNTNVNGSLPAKSSRLQDDFNLAVSYDWYKTAKIPSNMMSYGSLSILSEQHKKEIISILEGTTYDSHEEQLIQTLYKQALDWKERNKAGIKPAIPDLRRIQNVSNLEELKVLLAEKNSPTASIADIELLNVDFMNSEYYLPLVMEPNLMLPDADWYTEELSQDAQRSLKITKEFYSKMLIKFGYKKDVAAQMIDSVFELEMKYCPAAYGTTAMSQLDFLSKIYNVYTKEEYQKTFPNLPLIEKFNKNGADFITKIQVFNPECHKIVNDLFTDENFEALKNWSILFYVQDVATFLDKQCYNIYLDYINKKYGTNIKRSDSEIAYSVANSLPMAIGKVWVEKKFSPEIKEDVTNITKQLIDIFADRIKKVDWMSEQTKKTSLEKLNSIAYFIGYPDEWTDYSTLDLPVNYKDGSLFDSIQEISLFRLNREIEKLKKPVNKLEWDMSPQTVNAYYDSTNNSINILAGILGTEIYQYDWPIEKKIGGIGVIIGHELTHGFDAHGSQFDKKGNMVNWWTQEDFESFNQKNQYVADYYSTFEVVPDVMTNGLLCVGEIVADIGGLTFATEYGKKIENFDFDLMFRQFAKVWQEISSYEGVKQQAQFDEHPINFIRINGTVQQNNTFYDTYNVIEGDGMYLEPEKRIKIW